MLFTCSETRRYATLIWMYLTFNLLEEIHFICWLTTNDHGGGFDISETKGVVLATSIGAGL